MKPFTVAFLLFAIAVPAPALADPTLDPADRAVDLLRQGKYEEAIRQGVAENTADGLASAAIASVSEMTMAPPPCLACINRAEELSRKALAADPKGANATRCLVAALGYRGRLIGFLSMQSAKLGEASRQALDEALAVHPHDPGLLSAMGTWHLEVVRVAGSVLADWTYGATTEKGLEDFSEALKLAPDDVIINFQFGLELAAYDADQYRDKIVTAWKRAKTAPSQSAYDDAQKKRADELLMLLNGGDRQAFDDKVKSYMGIPE
jgi:tetratricopeptide (TPR) repeat protein